MDDNETMYRIEYTIQRKLPGEEEFTDVGFGSSGASSDIDGAEYAMGSYIQNRQWETEPGMPDPKELKP